MTDNANDDEARDALADLILSVDRPDLQKYMPAGFKREVPWYRPNGKQAAFGAMAGILALFVAFGQIDGSPLAPSVIGILLIAWALGYSRRE